MSVVLSAGRRTEEPTVPGGSADVVGDVRGPVRAVHPQIEKFRQLAIFAYGGEGSGDDAVLQDAGQGDAQDPADPGTRDWVCVNRAVENDVEVKLLAAGPTPVSFQRRRDITRRRSLDCIAQSCLQRRLQQCLRQGHDDGASTVEFLVWFPAFILLVVMLLQVFQFVWARESAQNAARYGTYQARVWQGSDADGRRQASAYLEEVAGSLVQDPSITVTHTDDEVTVSITARPRQIPLPALHLPAFTVHASGPLEQFTAGR